MKIPLNNMRSYIISFSAFLISMYLISLFRYGSWVRDIVLHGVPENYNLARELFYVIPYFGPLMTILDVVAINLFSLSVGVLVYYIANSNINYRHFVRKNIIPITLTILAGLTVSLGLSVNDCILNIDDIMREHFGNTVARYINLGSNQLQVIGSTLSGMSIIYTQRRDNGSESTIFK